MNSTSLLYLVGWAAFVFAWPWLLGAGGGRQASETWYGDLKKSRLTPPGWVFGVVWTVLYCLMAVAAWKVTRRGVFKGDVAIAAVAAFVVLTTLMAFWSRLLFKMRRGDLAFIDFCFVYPVAILTTVLFWKIHRSAGICLLPLDAWLTFAFYLNWQAWRLNLPFWNEQQVEEDVEP